MPIIGRSKQRISREEAEIYRRLCSLLFKLIGMPYATAITPIGLMTRNFEILAYKKGERE